MCHVSETPDHLPMLEASKKVVKLFQIYFQMLKTRNMVRYAPLFLGWALQAQRCVSPSLCVYPLVLGVSPYAVIECHCLKCAKGFGGKGFSIMPGGEFFQPLSVYIYRQKGLQLILQRPMSPWKRWEHTYVKGDVQRKGDTLRK